MFLKRKKLICNSLLLCICTWTKSLSHLGYEQPTMNHVFFTSRLERLQLVFRQCLNDTISVYTLNEASQLKDQVTYVTGCTVRFPVIIFRKDHAGLFKNWTYRTWEYIRTYSLCTLFSECDTNSHELEAKKIHRSLELACRQFL